MPGWLAQEWAADATLICTECSDMNINYTMQSARRPFLYRSRAWISIAIIAPVSIATIFSSPGFVLSDMGRVSLAIIGWLMFFTGAIFRWWATLYIGGRKDTRVGMICDGPYSIIRHPLYFGTILMGFSIAFFVQSICLAVALVLTAVIYLGLTLPKEEDALTGIYGDNYRTYMARVPGLWPNWSHYQSGDVITVELKGLRAEFIRMLRWMWIPFLAHALQHARVTEWWPQLLSVW